MSAHSKKIADCHAGTEHRLPDGGDKGLLFDAVPLDHHCRLCQVHLAGKKRIHSQATRVGPTSDSKKPRRKRMASTGGMEREKPRPKRSWERVNREQLDRITPIHSRHLPHSRPRYRQPRADVEEVAAHIDSPRGVCVSQSPLPLKDNSVLAARPR